MRFATPPSGRANSAPRRSSSRSASTRPEADPESPLEVSPAGFREAGRLLGALGLPTVLVQEGGYDLATIGPLVREVLSRDRATQR